MIERRRARKICAPVVDAAVEYDADVGEPIEIVAVAQGHRVSARVRSVIFLGLNALALAAGGIASRLHWFHPGAVMVVGVLAAFGVMVLMLRKESVPVRVTAGTISIGTRKFARAEVVSARHANVSGKSTLRLAGVGIDLEVDEPTAKKIIEELALDAGHSVATFSVGGRLSSTSPLFWNPQGYRLVVLAWLLPLLAAWKTLHWVTANVAYVGMALGAVFMTLLIVPSTIQIGADGVLIRWLGTRRFIPFSEVTAVTEAKQFGMAALAFTLRDGSTVRVVGGTTEQAPALARIREAMSVSERGAELPVQALLLERGTRSAREWLDHLRAIGAGAAATLRSADVDVDALWDVVADPKAKTSVRIAAAVALKGRGDEGVSERLRVATEASTAPRLRVAIEATEKGDDAALVEAIEEEIAGEEGKARG